jgi:hypothetical protein
VCTIRIGGVQADYFALTVYGREHPDATDYWDGNWLVCNVEIAAGAFRGCLDISLRTDELKRFHEQVERLNLRLSGAAELTTMEDWLRLRLTGDGRGRVEASCKLEDPASGNTLKFCLVLDQTYLQPLLQELAEVLRTYPITGELRV